MPLIVPFYVHNFRSSSLSLAKELEENVNKGRNTWTDQQAAELSLIYQILMNTHDALYRIVDANKEE